MKSGWALEVKATSLNICRHGMQGKLLSQTLAVQFFCELKQGKKALSRTLVFHSLVNLDHTQPVQTVGERRAGVGC